MQNGHLRFREEFTSGKNVFVFFWKWKKEKENQIKTFATAKLMTSEITHRIVKNAKVDEYKKSLQTVQYGEHVMKHNSRWNESEEAERPRDTQDWQQHRRASEPRLHVLSACHVFFELCYSVYSAQQENKQNSVDLKNRWRNIRCFNMFLVYLFESLTSDLLATSQIRKRAEKLESFVVETLLRKLTRETYHAGQERIGS